MDTRASLVNGNVVQVRTPAFYGYYQYNGTSARRELLQEDYGNTSRWNALTIGSQNATETTTNHPLTLTQGSQGTPGTLLTDPFSLTGVTLRLNTPVSVASSGSVSATATGGIRLQSAGALTVKTMRAFGVLNLEASSLAQDSTGTGVTNSRGPIELRSTSGDIGSSLSRFKVTTQDVASLFASTAGVGSAYFSSANDLALGSLISAGTLDISTTGALRDAGRNASRIGQASVNLQAPTLTLAAASFGTAVSPLVIGGGSSGQQTTLTATSTAGADGLMAFAAKGSTPVRISSLSINTSGSPSTPAGSIWLSGDGFASVSGSTPVINAGTLVLDGLGGIGTDPAALRTAINSLAGSVGANGVYLTNNAPLRIDTVSDRTSTRTYAGLVSGGNSNISTSSGALTVNGAISATAGNLSLSGFSDLLINASGSITTAGSGTLALNANTTTGTVNAASGSQLNLTSTGTATLTASTLVLQGVITTAGSLALVPSAASASPFGTIANAASTSRDSSTAFSPVAGVPLRMNVTGNDPYLTTYNSNQWNVADARQGDTWTLSVYAKADRSTSGQLFIFEANESGVITQAPATTIQLGTDWQRYSFTYTFTDPSTRSIQVRLDGPHSGGTGAAIWWDGLQVERANQASHFTISSEINRFATKFNPLDLHSGSNLNLATYLTAGQITELTNSGVAATSLDGSTANGEITTNLILGGTITSTNTSGLTLSSSRALALLGNINTSAGALSLSTSSADGLLVLGNLTALSNLSLSATAGTVRTTVPSTIKTTATTGGTTTVNGNTGAALYGSILAGAQATNTGPSWLAAASTPASFSLTSTGDVTLAGATAVAGATTITAPKVTITAAGGVISRGNLSISATGTATGQGLFSSGLLVAGGTVNTALTALTPSTTPSLSGQVETAGISTTSVQGSTLQAANIVLDAASTASLTLSVSRDAADAMVLGGSTTGSGNTQADLVVAGAWMAAPTVSITAPQSPRILHDLIARNGLTITANSATADNNTIRLSPLSQILLGSSDGTSSAATVDL
jgi:hypothetical protein